MLQSTIIGRIGSDAECKSYNGKEFTTFRVAHTDKWTDNENKVHEETTWIDCVINGKPNVIKYLVQGAQVYVSGTAQLRIYSSPKDKCMKAGMTINARTIELVGGKPDLVPNLLFRQDTGEGVDVTKHFFASALIRGAEAEEYIALVSKSAKQFVADRNGFITPFNQEPV